MASLTCHFEFDAPIEPPARADESSFLPPPRPAMESKRWAALVERIRSGNGNGLEELYKHFGKGIRYYLCRQLGPEDLDDRVHDIFLIVVDAILRGEVREPDRLMGYIRTVVRRQTAVIIGSTVQVRKEEVELEFDAGLPDERSNPEQSIIREQQILLLKEMLEGISDRDREILTRFYLDEEPVEEICARMGLSNTQFRLLKSRAKARFSAISRRRFNERGFYKNP